MPSGVPMIVRWTIHSPIIATDETEMSSGIRRSLPPRPERHRFRVLGYQVLGAEARQITWPDGSSWQPRLASVTGLIVDLHGRVVPGARVWINGMGDTVVTDSAGVFRLPRPMIGGLFSVVAADSTLAAGGINQTPPRTFLVSDDRIPTRDVNVDVLKMYPRADALRAACPNNNYVAGQGVAILRVIDTAGVPAVRAHVDMETMRAVVVGDTIVRPVRRSGEVGYTGGFLVCGASLQQPMTFRASLGDEHGEAAITRWADDVMVVTIHLHSGAP
jgi:hypothetical protein